MVYNPWDSWEVKVRYLRHQVTQGRNEYVCSFNGRLSSSIMVIKLCVLSALLNVFCIQCISSLQCPDGWQQSAVDTQKCYLVVANKTTWQEAEQFCQQTVSYAHLTSVLSAFESSSISGQLLTACIAEKWKLTKMNQWLIGHPLFYFLTAISEK